MAEPAARKPASPLHVWRWPLHWQIMLGLLIGAALGYLAGSTALDAAVQTLGDKRRAADIVTGAISPAEADQLTTVQALLTRWLYLIADLVGDLFISGLKLIIVPIVTSSIILAVVNIGSGKGFGRLGGKTLAYYACTSLIAILVGLTLVNLVEPGISKHVAPNDAWKAENVIIGQPPFDEHKPESVGILQGRDLSAFADAQAEVEAKAGGKTGTDFLDVFREMVPPNIVAAAANGSLLGLIVVSLVIGYFLARYDHESQGIVVGFVKGVYDITLKITDLVLALAPIGVLGLLAATVAEQYAKLAPDDRFADFIEGIVTFAGVALGALAFHFLITMPLIMCLIARVNPLRHYKAMAPALMTAFSTASSSATLPLTIECVEDRAGVSNRVASFTLPLGATVNMDGTALYECVAAIFICQAFGIDLTLGQQFMIVVVALLTSVGVAGVPAASLVAIIVILQAVQNQLPPGLLPEGVLLTSGLGLLFVFDRPLDMCRTAVNIFSDSVGAVTIAKTEGETDVLTV